MLQLGRQVTQLDDGGTPDCEPRHSFGHNTRDRSSRPSERKLKCVHPNQCRGARIKSALGREEKKLMMMISSCPPRSTMRILSVTWSPLTSSSRGENADLSAIWAVNHLSSKILWRYWWKQDTVIDGVRILDHFKIHKKRAPSRYAELEEKHRFCFFSGMQAAWAYFVQYLLERKKMFESTRNLKWICILLFLQVSYKFFSIESHQRMGSLHQSYAGLTPITPL